MHDTRQLNINHELGVYAQRAGLSAAKVYQQGLSTGHAVKYCTNRFAQQLKSLWFA